MAMRPDWPKRKPFDWLACVVQSEMTRALDAMSLVASLRTWTTKSRPRTSAAAVSGAAQPSPPGAADAAADAADAFTWSMERDGKQTKKRFHYEKKPRLERST